MSTFDVVAQHGPWRLAAFLAAVAVFLLLHLVRWPFCLIDRALLAVQRGVDARLTSALSSPTTTHEPVSHHDRLTIWRPLMSTRNTPPEPDKRTDTTTDRPGLWDRTVSAVAWYAPELTGATVAGAAAATVWAPLGAISAALAAWIATDQVRLARGRHAHRAVTQPTKPAQLDTTDHTDKHGDKHVDAHADADAPDVAAAGEHADAPDVAPADHAVLEG